MNKLILLISSIAIILNTPSTLGIIAIFFLILGLGEKLIFDQEQKRINKGKS